MRDLIEKFSVMRDWYPAFATLLNVCFMMVFVFAKVHMIENILSFFKIGVILTIQILLSRLGKYCPLSRNAQEDIQDGVPVTASQSKTFMLWLASP